jgi:hypothetical protein
MTVSRAGAGLALLLLGFATGWVLSPGPFRRLFTTTRPLQISGAHGERLGLLPTGTTVVSKLPLDESKDVEWWCLVPVDFGAMPDARQVVKERGSLRRWEYIGNMLNVVREPEDSSSPKQPRNK